ncbi:hypothetical protein PybrP1_003281 [[Pythium] brassicae (nom. inval.)]|nr:hypothetical protein PybrP1_003281 [[Pythium] brassicae (nom. inval.)]
MRSSTSDFTSSLRSSRSSPSTTPRGGISSSSSVGAGGLQHHGRTSASYTGMNISVPATTSSPSHSTAGGSARSSPHGSVSVSSSRRSSYSSQQQQQPQQGHYHTAQQLAPAYLQRAAISNSYNSRGDDETSSNVSESLSIGNTSASGSVGGGGALSSPVGSSGSRYSERGNNFKVVIRVRPPLPRELHGDRPFQNVIGVDAPGHVLTVCENLSALTDADGNAAPGAYGSHTFSFDHVYDQQCTQSAVYENTAKAGFNSGSGSVEERGIIPRAIEQIFCHIQSNISARMRFLVRASYLQIYNESISDLLKPERNNLTIREDKKRGVFVEGLSEWVVRSPEEIYGLMERGGAMRATGSTKMNEVSSRSHAVFIIIAEQSRTSYVDARGTEIPADEFTAMVNAYQARHAGGKAAKNANGTLVLHPKLESMIRQSFKKSLLRKYERELKRLRAELDEKSRNVVDKRRLLELDEQRRRAEEDKMAAIRALEERSREFMKEKEEKKKLEQRISMLTSQMLMSSQRKPGGGGGGGGALDADGNQLGGCDVEDPAVRDAIKEHQDRIRKEYECRLADLEKERECIEEEKAQVDRYKQLLLKQRDIMIALTQRLNERDEQITALQDELDAYDRHQKELEEKLDEKTAHLIHLQRVTMEHNVSSPGKTNAEVMKALGDWGSSSAAQSPGAAIAGGVGGGGLATPPTELLITHKQFRPHTRHEIVHNNNGPGGAHERLLSAEEKIQELKVLVDSHAAEHARLARELEEVKSEKVSVEFVLRERVEKLVQTELATRMKQQSHTAAGDNNVAAPASLAQTEKLVQLAKHVKTLESENQQLRHLVRVGASSSSSSTEQHDEEHNKQLQARCETLVKERKAVQTIMEHKIKALVTAISEASDATLQSAGGVEQLGEPAKRLTREVHALQRLVNASIIALRNAEGAGSGALAPPSSTKVSGGSEAAPTRAPPAAVVSQSLDASSGGKPARTGVTVEELIQQRREQLQRERQEAMDK